VRVRQRQGCEVGYGVREDDEAEESAEKRDAPLVRPRSLDDG
jgi:hypothetical protein